ncbi:DUF2911 domain-containing protein [Ferruginibacter sp. HRS2-29]|uniref:DUF2911 domain-containing protein n=1 Tax=Ferruginibacter sp. HRS2-29 TaxID=2487334 RepID=UPI0020CBF68B|nr:DUF2911 domain-containing protein [Ferruginibacter sp. HRS2-29]MCP9751106.1 DUF2911 domain-containing protein [Ferruginibacter sp. HRS2-29]
MKKILSLAVIASLFSFGTFAQKKAEDKSKRPSPPATATATVNGTVITINYSVVSLKGRTIGTDVEPKTGQVWRTGANEATTFEVSKDVTIGGNKLPAGKYGLFTIYNGSEATVIFNKTWDQWGAYDYKAAADAFRIKVPVGKASPVADKLNFSIDAKGKVTWVWGDTSTSFEVKTS